MINDIQTSAKKRMEQCIDALKTRLSKVRTGRAHPDLLNGITVDYYGSQTPLSQVASVNNADPRTLSITPWEKQLVPVIEKAIIDSDLGLTPNSAGTVIRIAMPPLTEERRRELTKVVRAEGETAKVAVRNIRRDANDELKEALKEKLITEDEEHRGIELIQKLTDQFIHNVDGAIEAKEADVMEV